MNQQQKVIEPFNTNYPDMVANSKKWVSKHTLFQYALKRSIDIFASIMFFAMFGWVYLILWGCVVVTTGRPSIYRHPRIGLGGKEFDCLKFRSMVKNSDEVLQAHLANNPLAKMEWEKDFKLRNDPRITKFGRFIRKSSLDELPQFWNVLRGDMSLVGPRPVVVKELVKYYGKDASYYASVKPGITGPWQVGGRNDLEYDERIKLDVAYAKNWSIWSDFGILFKTVYVVIARRGSF